MAMEMRQQLKMSQQLVMTPQLQQAIKLLQLTRLELQDLVLQELEENPLLEESTELEEIREPDTHRAGRLHGRARRRAADGEPADLGRVRRRGPALRDRFVGSQRAGG